MRELLQLYRGVDMREVNWHLRIGETDDCIVAEQTGGGGGPCLMFTPTDHSQPMVRLQLVREVVT